MCEIGVKTFIARQEMRAVKLEAELATLKNAVMPVVAWWKELKQQPGFCPVPGANFFVLGQHGDKNRVDIKQLDALAALVGGGVMRIADIKTFELTDLVGRTVCVRSFKEDSTEIIIAHDIKSGEIFVLKEIQYATALVGEE